jgi:hypothetical protein
VDKGVIVGSYNLQLPVQPSRPLLLLRVSSVDVCSVVAVSAALAAVAVSEDSELIIGSGRRA